ncbi:MAG TPA: PilZ domain-containing protein [Methylomirabilota bacterium]|nr:PilZ domain-containing protein [Methylomirabilota bacterium]
MSEGRGDGVTGLPSQQPAPEKGAVAGPRKDTRRHPRESATWPVMLYDGTRWLRTETVNVSPFGAKVRLRERLEPGDGVRLQIRLSGRKPFEVPAIVWRIDRNGSALLFLGVQVREFRPTLDAGPFAADSRTAANLDQRRTVLLAEDNSEVRAQVRAALEAQGCAVLDAGADPEQAIRIAKEHPGAIHLLLADLVLATLSGPDLVGEVLALRPKIKTMFMSAYPLSATELDGACVIAKPFKTEDLSGKIREVLDSQSHFVRPRRPPVVD